MLSFLPPHCSKPAVSSNTSSTSRYSQAPGSLGDGGARRFRRTLSGRGKQLKVKEVKRDVAAAVGVTATPAAVSEQRFSLFPSHATNTWCFHICIYRTIWGTNVVRRVLKGISAFLFFLLSSFTSPVWCHLPFHLRKYTTKLHRTQSTLSVQKPGKDKVNLIDRYNMRSKFCNRHWLKQLVWVKKKKKKKALQLIHRSFANLKSFQLLILL